MHRDDLARHVGEALHQVRELAPHLLADVGRLDESCLPLEHVAVERRGEEPGAHQANAAAEALRLLERPLRHVGGADGVLHPHDDDVTVLAAPSRQASGTATTGACARAATPFVTDSVGR